MVIISQKKADEVLLSCLQEPVIALDTEFLWTRTYNAEPSLIQIASATNHYIIDLLAINNYDSIAKLLVADNTKIFHSGSQDLKLLKNITGVSCKNIFDSQIASAFLNLDYQISYQRLVDHYYGIELEPATSYLNWLKRPLTKQQIKYALNDVIYLIKIYPLLIEKLKIDKKYTWVIEEINNTFDENFYKINLPNYRSVKNWQNLTQDKLAIINQLVILRDKIAKDINKRPNFTLHDKLLIYLSHKKELNIKTIKSLKINSIIKNKYAQEIIETWQKGKDTPSDSYPKLPLKIKSHNKFNEAEIKIKKLVNKKAQEYAIHRTLLLSQDKQRKIIDYWQNNNNINNVLKSMAT